jgi:hypothetical protein
MVMMYFSTAHHKFEHYLNIVGHNASGVFPIREKMVYVHDIHWPSPSITQWYCLPIALMVHLQAIH